MRLVRTFAAAAASLALASADAQPSDASGDASVKPRDALCWRGRPLARNP